MQTHIHGYPKDSRVSIGEASRLVGVSITTLRRWEREGKVASTRTPGNQRRYSIEDIEALASGETPGSADHSPASPTTKAGAA